MILAVIPARGGSKGIPRKNLLRVGGLPLIAHSILHARRSRYVDRVIVSTDNDEIAHVATDYGAVVVPRPVELAHDEAPSEPAVRHALDTLRAENLGEVEMVVFLQATSPLRQPGDIDGAIDRIRADGADSLFSACHQHGFVWRASDAGLESLTYDFRNRRRRQDLDGQDWQENGSFYIFRPWVLDELGNRLGGKVTVWPMHPLDSFEMDEPADAELFSTLLALRRSPGAPMMERVRLMVLDFDGVLTDNRVLVDADGREAVFCDRGDGWGIARVRELGIPVVIVSTEHNGVVPARARKLGVECIHGCDDKAAAIHEIADRYRVDLDEVAFVANDENDLHALQLVGIPIAVRDARPEVVAVAAATTTSYGGRGAAREVCDWIVAAHAQHERRADPG